VKFCIHKNFILPSRRPFVLLRLSPLLLLLCHPDFYFFVISTFFRCHLDLFPLSSRPQGEISCSNLPRKETTPASATRDFSLRFEMTAGVRPPSHARFARNDRMEAHLRTLVVLFSAIPALFSCAASSPFMFLRLIILTCKWNYRSKLYFIFCMWNVVSS